ARGSARAEGQADHHAHDQAEAEGGGDRLAGVVADEVLGHLVALAGHVADLAVAIAEALAGGLGGIAGRVGHLRGGAGRPGGEVAEELLDRLAALAGALLDPADELVDVAAMERQVVVGQLAPSLLELAADLVPLALDFLSVDHRRRDSRVSVPPAPGPAPEG